MLMRKKSTKHLSRADIRSDFDYRDLNLGKKVREAKNEKITYWCVIGDKEVESNNVTLDPVTQKNRSRSPSTH